MTIEKSKIAELNRLHGEIEQALRQSLSNAIQIGQRLEEVKKELPHGEFTGFITANLSFSVRTAQNYMKLYQNQEQIAGAESVQDAYKLLSGKNETVSHLEAKNRSVFESEGLVELVENWWDQRAPLALILDAAGWSVQEIAEKFKQPVDNISAIIDPQPHEFGGGTEDGPPEGWSKAVSAEISSMLASQYKRASEMAPREGYPEVEQELKTLSHYHHRRSERLKWYRAKPFHFVDEGGRELKLEWDMDISAGVLMWNTVRDALGIQRADLSANWLCGVIHLGHRQKNITDRV